MIKISPSILSADFSKLGTQIKTLEDSGADLIHIDVMDGNFVPNLSFGFPIIKSIRTCSSLPFDVHLMIDEPSRYIDEFASSGADLITVHYETEKHLDRLIDHIKSCNVKAGIALNPATPVSCILPVLHKIDLVLIMSVNPGYGGQKFIPYTLEKVTELRNIKEKNNYTFSISIDGGVTIENCVDIAAAGVDIIVAGSSVFKNNAIKENLASIIKILSHPLS
ncbi:ribulose-phosphate 3-epimerase [Clostridium oryzae]|uniref:Ribulose-phosphate 3-epimerase n=1 Tax=Clostridium oryzae TaxID=1450648 RepID=A0A1V4IUE3_9CLOT|nr:ribulose-phosphate 3-epimerase [Clostridium oryzae]OPJ63556.1 ribulose-phosphate 3-epimerase [Clostridium oryzae]